MNDFNRGLLQGQANMRRTLEEVEILKNSYLNENERLTTLLLDAELEIEDLKKRIIELS